jgi:hypothetical protein
VGWAFQGHMWIWLWLLEDCHLPLPGCGVSTGVRHTLFTYALHLTLFSSNLQVLAFDLICTHQPCEDYFLVGWLVGWFIGYLVILYQLQYHKRMLLRASKIMSNK